MWEKYPLQLTALLCLFLMFASIGLVLAYNMGRGDGQISAQSPIYRLSDMPRDTPVLALYQSGGIVTMVSAMRLDDGRILPHNVYGGPVPYDVLEEPFGWTTIPEGLMEVLR